MTRTRANPWVGLNAWRLEPEASAVIRHRPFKIAQGGARPRAERMGKSRSQINPLPDPKGGNVLSEFRKLPPQFLAAGRRIESRRGGRDFVRRHRNSRR
jgi:hypothetical protein